MKSKRQIKNGVMNHFSKFLILVLLITISSCSSPVKTRDETYIEIEKEQISLTYLVKDKVLHYERISGAILLNQNPKYEVYTVVTNTSDYGGVFKLKTKISCQGNTLEFETEDFIASGETKELKQVKEINPFSFEANVTVDYWKIIPPTKEVDVQVAKHRTVVVN